MRDTLIQLAYLLAAFLFLMALRALGKPDTARRGMRLAAFGMAVGIAATLLNAHIVSFEWILVGSVIGAVAGYPLGKWVPMTAMPQRIALSHALGALAATLVGVGEYYNGLAFGQLSRGHVIALSFEVLLGGLTVTGSLMAFGKLQEILPGRPLTFRGQNAFNLTILAIGVASLVWLVVNPTNVMVAGVMLAVGLALGVLLVLPIGGADMPVVVSLLNSYAGLAAVATGFAIDNNILIIVGALDGLSGFILSVAMSKAMNRSFSNVLFGAFGSAAVAQAGGSSSVGGEMVPISAEDAALHGLCREGSDSAGLWPRSCAGPAPGPRAGRPQGGDVRFAIHPVAGRMPGHMNVLLAEAGVPYDKLVDMEDINEKFAETDVALVVGANDVVNPAAKTNPKSPIYGMPILKVAEAKSVIALKRGRGAGFSGVENELFVDPKTSMLFGDAKQSLITLGLEVKNA
jgi:NAD(P) transhydrogenase subunit beta